MRAKGLRSFPFLAIGIGIAVFFVYQIGSVGPPNIDGDSVGYTKLMVSSWQDYKSQLLVLWRPWFVPVFYSLFGPYSPSSASAIVMAQTYIQFFAWILFGASLRRFVHGRIARGFLLILVGSLIFSQGYYRLNQFLLSDSLALSSLLIQWAACISGRQYLQWARRQRYECASVTLYVFTVAALTAITMGTRDANILLALAGIVFVIVDTRRGLLTIRPLVILIVLVGLITAGQIHGSHIRHAVNANNLLFDFVLPNPEAQQFFADRGMPRALADLGPGLPKSDFGDMRIELDNSSRYRNGPAVAAYLSQFDWVYAEYLVSHPAWVVSTAFANRDLIFEQGGRFHILPQDGRIPSMVTDLLPIEFWLVIFCVSLAATAALGGWRRAGLPAMVGILGGANALGAFFADLWIPSEMARHAFIGSIVLRIGVILALAVFLDVLGDRIERPPAWSRHGIKR